MSNCKYCGRQAPYTLSDGGENSIKVCDICYSTRKKSFEKEKLKLVHTDLRLIKKDLRNIK